MGYTLAEVGYLLATWQNTIQSGGGGGYLVSRRDEMPIFPISLKFPDFFSLYRNSLTSPGFPGRWTP